MALTERSPALAADGADLLALVELALAEARTLGAAQAEAAVSMDVGPQRLGAARRSRDRRIPARSRHGRHRVLRHAQGHGEHRGPEPARRCARPSPRPAASRASRPRIRARACRTRRTLATRRCPTSTSRIPGTSRRSAPARLAHRLRGGRDARSTRASPIRKARPSARTAACARTAIRTASSAAYPGTVAQRELRRCSARKATQMERDYWYSTARDWRELEAAESVGRTQRRAGGAPARRAQAGDARRRRCCSARTWRAASSGISSARCAAAASIARASFLLDAAGQQVFPEWFALSERPHLPQGARAARRSTSEGVATRDRELVAGGVLLGYVLGTYSARKLGLQDDRQRRRHAQPARAGPRPATSTRMLARLGRGLLRHRADGAGRQRRDRRLFARRGGFWVENGKLAYPVHEVTDRRQPQGHVSTASSTSARTSTCAAASARARSWSRK